MGLLKKLLGLDNQISVQVKVTGPSEYKPGPDLRKPYCPSCGGKLDKVPGAKKLCPHCGKYIFVRTRPIDNARVLVNEVGVEKIEEDWATANGTFDEYQAEKKRVSDTKERLSKRFGTEASDGDVKWV